MSVLKQNLFTSRYERLDGHMKEVVRGAGVTFAIKVASAGFAFGFNVLLARLLGAEGAGIYFLALTLATIATTIGRFGLENTLLRFVAAHAAKEEWGAVKGVFRKGMLISLVVSLGVSALLFSLAPWFADQVFATSDLAFPLRLMALAVVPFALYWLIAEALKGLKRIRDSQLVQGLTLPVLTCSGLTLIGGGWGPGGAAGVYLVAACAVFLWGVFLWQRATPQFKGVEGNFSGSKVFDSCVPLLWVQLMYMVMQWASILFLGVWGTKADVGVFAAASRTAMLTSFVLTSVNSIVAPKFAAFYSQGDMQGLASMARQSTKMMMAFAAPILLAFIVAPELVMSMFGNDFSEGGVFLAIMSLGQFVNVATGSVGYLLIMTGNERLMRNNTMAVGVLVILLNLMLIPLWGALGAAVATAISTALLNLGAFCIAWKMLGIWPLPVGVRQGK